jgi:hypothetical protein
MTKEIGIVYNNCYGGFSLSLEAQKLYLEKKGYTPIYHSGPYSWDKRYSCAEIPDFYDREIPRHDQDLVAVVQELGKKSYGDCARLAIKWVEEGTLYKIDEYDGNESVETKYTDDEWCVAK